MVEGSFFSSLNSPVLNSEIQIIKVSTDYFYKKKRQRLRFRPQFTPPPIHIRWTKCQGGLKFPWGCGQRNHWNNRYIKPEPVWKWSVARMCRNWAFKIPQKRPLWVFSLSPLPVKSRKGTLSEIPCRCSKVHLNFGEAKEKCPWEDCQIRGDVSLGKTASLHGQNTILRLSVTQSYVLLEIAVTANTPSWKVFFLK